MTKIRSSSQLYVDANLNVNTKKIENLVAGTGNTDAVNLEQLNTAIANATLGQANALHVPVADLTAAKAIISTDRVDKMMMLVESLGVYRFDAESSVASNNDTVVRPNDIVSDASPGRWIKMTPTITDHNNMSNIQGGSSGERYHLTAAQIAALHPAETASSIGAIVNGAAAATPNDTDLVATVETSVVKKITWTNVKAFLKTYFDTLYNKYIHPNHTGDVTSVADGATTIAAGVVTNAKLANVATATFKGRTTAGTGSPEDLTVAQARTLLGLTSLNLAQRKYRVTPTGTVNGSNVVFTIADLVISGTEEVFKNGVLQVATVDYTITYAATTTITFTVAPNSVDYIDNLMVNYSI